MSEVIYAMGDIASILPWAHITASIILVAFISLVVVVLLWIKDQIFPSCNPFEVPPLAPLPDWIEKEIKLDK